MVTNDELDAARRKALEEGAPYVDAYLARRAAEEVASPRFEALGTREQDQVTVTLTERGRAALDNLQILLQSRHHAQFTLDEVLERALRDLGGVFSFHGQDVF